MSTVIVKTENKDRWGQTCTWVGVGKVTVHKDNGMFETEEGEGLNELLELFPEFKIVNIDGEPLESISTKSEVNTLGKEVVNELSDKAPESELQQKAPEIEVLPEEDKADVLEAYLENLNSKTRKELEDMCASFPSSEWRGKKKEELVTYLMEKLEQQ